MPTPENLRVGGCYIWVISFLLFVFTILGAIFLLLYVTQPTSVATSSTYAIIGVFLVFLPWLFWLVMFLYRVVSRSCGFRMICFGPFGSGYRNDDVKNAPAARSDLVSNNVARSNLVSNNVDAVVIPVDNDGPVGYGNQETTSPRRVHFGEIVIIGKDSGANANDNQGGPQIEILSGSPLSFASSRRSNESETVFS